MTKPRTLFGHPIRQETTAAFYPTPWSLDDFEAFMEGGGAGFAQNMRVLGGHAVEARFCEQWVETWLAWSEIETEEWPL